MRMRFHEIVFAVTAVGALVALLLHGDGLSLLAAQIAVCLVVYIAAISWLAGRASLSDERLRLLANFAFNSWFYGITSQVSLALHAVALDMPLLRFDEVLCGVTPAVSMERVQSRWLTDVMSFC